ncbi:serine proteinase stubble isoform X2 [Parasteatoda tepidariorum]|uniref:serine proteinase stubble isoform X2 n=1 Tax=Parasteatoda tepidariorum TaxID=114398 RepID=UPI001C72742F|nr:serine proteinase stubble isoform X2 [Parasteatoda tepidariorum]
MQNLLTGRLRSKALSITMKCQYQKACTLMYYTLLVFLIIGQNASTIKIRPESCTNAMGDKGTCMFVWQCIKSDGVQLGPCVDRFLVGTCCSLPKEEDNLVPGSSGSSSNSSMPPFSPPKGDLPNKVKPAASSVQTTVVTKPPILMTTAPLTIGTFNFPTTNARPISSSTIQSTVAQQTSSTTTTAKPDNRDSLECGIPALFPKSKVVGGTHSSFGEWPWQVSVRRSSFFGFASTHRCGGAILNANWIATAAHCVDDLLKSQIRIRVGEFDFSTVQEPAPFQERGIEKKVVHPRYNFFTYEHDLALVKLESPLTLQPHVRPICLPDMDDTFIGLNATVTGWGRLSEGGTLPSKLQQVQVPIISNEKCQQMFHTAGRQESIPDIFLCAGYEAGGRDSCQGDSGGPLQAKRKDGRWFLAGIISWGIGCAEPNMPGVCTRISKFTNWIMQVIS